jgi:glyoxylase-like metal-dependent hydrolase (beta-lactamase superfamily II)
VTGWFRVSRVAPRTWALVEHRYWQRNVLYLLEGDDEAVLFDSGSGRRDVRPALAALTDRPIAVLASHAHYDHVGNHHRFSRVWAVDLPAVRADTRDDRHDPGLRRRLVPRHRTHRVTRWLAPGEPVDLGGRVLTPRALPGHSSDSVGLVDAHHGLVLVGDLLYDGPLLACLPTADVHDYRASLYALRTDHAGARLLAGHTRPDVAPGALSHADALLDRALQDAARTRPPRLQRRTDGPVTMLVGRSALAPRR